MNKNMEERLLQPEVDYICLLMNAVDDVEDYLHDHNIHGAAEPGNLELRLPKNRKLAETRQEFGVRITNAIANFDAGEYARHLEDAYKVKPADAQMLAWSLEEKLSEASERIRGAMKEA